MRVLVTGGSGYVGSIVCQRLAQEHEVINFDRRPANEPHGRFLRGDILSSAHLIDAMRDVDAVVHLAAIPDPRSDPSDAIMEINVMGTQRVVEAAALGSPRRVVVASSDSTYGFVFGRGEIMPDYLPVDEAHPARPLDAYGLSKLIKEEICRRYTRDTGLETICLRYCWVWNEGTYTQLEQLSTLPEAFVGQLWGYVDVRDVAQAIARSLVAPNITHETLLIGADSTFQKRPTTELVAEYLPAAIELRDPAWFADNPHRALLDCSRAKAVIGFAPEYDCWEQAGKTA
jgi:UDP-glucose 4-epimerase